MKYTLALFCLILAIIINTSSIQAYPFEDFSISSYEIAEAVPVKKGVKKSKQRASKLKKKKFSKKRKLKPKTPNKKKRLIYTFLIIGGFILAILSIVLIVLLAPTLGATITGIGMGLIRYFGVFGIVISSLGALFLILLGFLFLNNTSKENKPLSPIEELAAESAKKYPNIPDQKIEAYAELGTEIAQIKEEKEALEGDNTEESKEKLRLLDSELKIKQEKQTLLEELNQELGTVEIENRMGYIFLKEEIYILNRKKELLGNSKDESNKARIKKLDARIEDNLKNMKALKK